MVEAGERALAQVTVQCVESEALAGRERDGVLQDDGGTIVKRRVVVAKTVHYTVERSQDRRANLHEYVEANVHRAPLGSVITCNPILVTRVNRARFVVPADAYAAARCPHAIKEQARELLDIGQLCHIAQFAAANAQVEDDLAGGTQVWFDHAPQFVSVVLQPANDCLCVRAGRQVTGTAKYVVSQARMDVFQSFEQRPRGLLTDGQVVILRLDLLLIGRVDHADTEPGADQRVEQRQFLLGKREGPVIARDDVRGSCERIGLTEHRVRGGNGEVTDCAGMHHVTEIDYATDLSSFFACCTGCADQHIVIVGIAVNDARAQRGQDGQHLRFKARE